jgi:hypothetical protein
MAAELGSRLMPAATQSVSILSDLALITRELNYDLVRMGKPLVGSGAKAASLAAVRVSNPQKLLARGAPG